LYKRLMRIYTCIHACCCCFWDTLPRRVLSYFELPSHTCALPLAALHCALKQRVVKVCVGGSEGKELFAELSHVLDLLEEQLSGMSESEYHLRMLACLLLQLEAMLRLY